MEKENYESQARVIFLDNLRYSFVLCVVLVHSSNAYLGNLPMLKWWPVLDNNSNTAIGLLSAILNMFAMPLLYFIAGYFALPGIRKHGIPSFIGGKLKRLGIPWIVCTLTICPILPLIYHYTRDSLILSSSYLDLWITLIKSFLQFNIGIIPSMNELMMNNGFYQRYMWFISLLLLFFVIFSLVYRAKKFWFDTDETVTRKNPSISSSLKLLCVVGLLSFIGIMIAASIVLLSGHKDPMSWYSLANIIQFQPASFPVFLIYFVMGVIVYRNKWIERGKFPGHLNTWLISTGILIIMHVFVLYAFLTAPSGSEAQNIYGFSSVPVSSLLTMSFLGSFSSLAIKYWNRPTRIDRNMASNSYYIYLSHYIFVLVFQLILFFIPGIPALLKFAIVSVSSIIFAYIVSEFLIKPYPKLTISLLFTMLIVMFIVIR